MALAVPVPVPPAVTVSSAMVATGGVDRGASSSAAFLSPSPFPVATDHLPLPVVSSARVGASAAAHCSHCDAMHAYATMHCLDCQRVLCDTCTNLFMSFSLLQTRLRVW